MTTKLNHIEGLIQMKKTTVLAPNWLFFIIIFSLPFTHITYINFPLKKYIYFDYIK